jgi:subtilisin family serine protease
MSEAARQGLLRDARVARVEPDGIATIVTTQTGATWGLDRIDQHSLPLSTTYGYAKTGLGVTAYVIDTGMRFDHSEFGGRATSGFDAIDGGAADDCHGHGTHVGGTIGGSTYGVDRSVTGIRRQDVARRIPEALRALDARHGAAGDCRGSRGTTLARFMACRDTRRRQGSATHYGRRGSDSRFEIGGRTTLCQTETNGCFSDEVRYATNAEDKAEGNKRGRILRLR